VLAGAQARALGRGGIATVSRAAAMARSTVQKAVAEVHAGVDPAAPVRRPGAGRKRLIDKDPDQLLLNLDDLVEPDARGDPMCPLRWTSRLWSAVTSNWRGRPLTSHEVVVNLIGATTNKKGLKVRAHLDTGYYPTGVKVTNKELAAVPLTRHEFHGNWNYTVHHAPPSGASTTTA